MEPQPAEEPLSENEPPLVFDQAHGDACHERWIKGMNRQRPEKEEDIPDAWTNEQCGQCRFYYPLQGYLKGDWGVCSNPRSPFDGKAMFEHDGCDHYLGANEWVGGYINSVVKAQQAQSKQ